MKRKGKTKLKASHINEYLWMFVAIWSVGVFSSMGWNTAQPRRFVVKIAAESAGISYEKDMLLSFPEC